MRTLIKILYRDDPEKLLFRSLYGCKEGVIRSARSEQRNFREEKRPMSPEKRVLLNSVFKRRLQSQELSPDDPRFKENYRNTKIKHAFGHLRREQISMENTVCSLLESHEDRLYP